MKRPLRFALPLVLLLVTLLAHVVPAGAAAGITVEAADARSAFPDGLNFTLTASSDAKITSARLRYRLMPRTIQSTVRAECDGDKRATCKVTVGGSVGSVVYIVPFAEVRYVWEVTDAVGNTFTTDEASVTYDDVRFRWKSVSEGNLTLHFYTGEEVDARALLKAGREAVDQMSALLGTRLDFPVKVLEYANVRDLQEATTRGRRGGGNSVLLGQVPADDTAIVTRQTFGPDADRSDTMRHELAHIVTGEAVKDGGIESWINEGLSMYSQRVVERSYARALERAIRDDKVVTMTAINSTSVRENDADLFYAQAHAMVKFLIETHGEPKFREFIAALNADKTDGAMQAVYGFDKAGFENLWRESVGLTKREPAASTSGPSTGAPVILTVEPLTITSTSSGSVARPSEGSSSLPLMGAVVAAAFVLVAASGAVILRRKRA